MSKTIQYYCITPTDRLFKDIQDRFKLAERRDDYIYIDNHSSLLAVAHLDTVSDSFIQSINFECGYDPKLNKFEVTSIALDDRLGVYTLLETLRSFSLRYDILLTRDEEIGLSTAKSFQTDKQYNWMFSFDRRGINPVLYQYDSNDWRAILEENGYAIDYGSFSDIASLSALGIKGVNFGVGYHFEHTQSCHVDWNQYKQCIDMFRRFYAKNKHIRFPHIPTTHSNHANYNTAGWWNEWDGSDWRVRGVAPPAATTDAIVRHRPPYLTANMFCKECGEFLLAHEKKSQLCDYCLEKTVGR